MSYTICPNCHTCFNTNRVLGLREKLLIEFGPSILKGAQKEVELLDYLLSKGEAVSVSELHLHLYPYKEVVNSGKEGFHGITQLIYRTRRRLLDYKLPFVIETCSRNPPSWALRKLSHDRSA